MKNFIDVNDPQNIQKLIRDGLSLKSQPHAFDYIGQKKTLGLIFFNPSLRTRLSTQKAAWNLGMNVMIININDDGWKIETEEGVVMDGDKQEHLKDAIGVLCSYCDILGVRSFATLKNKKQDYDEQTLNQVLKYSTKPLINLESATVHPLQSLADCMTVQELKKAERPKVVLSWAPHPRALPQAVPNSFLQWFNEMDVELAVCHPEGYDLDPKFVGNSQVFYNQEEAFENADFIYAKNWSSYTSYGEILSKDPEWTIDEKIMDLTRQGVFMHCMPIRRNVIATDEVVDKSVIYQQAENRIYSAQAVIKTILQSC